MMLNRDEIKKLGIVQNAVEENFQATSYDLTIGNILDSDGKEHQDFNLVSGGIVHVISKEIISIPDNITAVAHVKTGMSLKGILALNIGLVDPTWNGPLSSSLVNFGDGSSKLLSSGQTFLRLTFYKNTLPTKIKCSKAQSIEEYTLAKRDCFHSNFSDSFLNIQGKIRSEIQRSIDNSFQKRVGIFAILFVLAQICLSWWLYVDPWDISSTYDQRAASKAMADITSQNVRLQKELSALEAELERQDNKRNALQVDSRVVAAQTQGQIERLQNRIRSLESRLSELENGNE